MKAFLVNSITRFVIFLLVKLDRTSKQELKKIPLNGPGLLITNHVSNVEGPVLYSRLRPRKTIALGKSELWDKKITRLYMDVWGCIPIVRGSVDQKAIGACLNVLDRGDFLCMAPEGSRSKSGIMKKAKPGIYLFVKPGVPVYPIGIWGLEKFSQNLKRLRRTPMHIRVGEPIFPERPEGRMTAEKRQEMVDSMMKEIARLIPEEFRGYYGEKTT